MEVETSLACVAEKHGVCAIGAVAERAGKVCRHRGRRPLRFSDGSVEGRGGVRNRRRFDNRKGRQIGTWKDIGKPCSKKAAEFPKSYG